MPNWHEYTCGNVATDPPLRYYIMRDSTVANFRAAQEECAAQGTGLVTWNSLTEFEDLKYLTQDVGGGGLWTAADNPPAQLCWSYACEGQLVR